MCRLFKDLGAYIVSADEVVHQLLSSPTALSRQVVDLFGAGIIVNGQIDRSQIAKVAFRQPALLKSLEELLHPAVREEIEKQYRHAASTSRFSLFVVEIPLLFETGADRFYDATLAVVADNRLCLQRFTEATGYDNIEFDRRMDRQLSQEEKARRATYTMINSGSLDDLKNAVSRLYKKLSQPPRQES